MNIENKKFLIYIIKYLGVALIAGSVVHVGTLQNGFTRYVILGFVGLGLMLLGNILEAKMEGKKIDLRYLAVITGLSFGTGFLSGGIQHYLDNPVYAGYLLAGGLFASYLTFFWKDHLSLKVKNIFIVAVASAALLLASLYLMPRQEVKVEEIIVDGVPVQVQVISSDGHTH